MVLEWRYNWQMEASIESIPSADPSHLFEPLDYSGVVERNLWGHSFQVEWRHCLQLDYLIRVLTQCHIMLATKAGSKNGVKRAETRDWNRRFEVMDQNHGLIISQFLSTSKMIQMELYIISDRFIWIRYPRLTIIFLDLSLQWPSKRNNAWMLEKWRKPWYLLPTWVCSLAHALQRQPRTDPCASAKAISGIPHVQTIKSGWSVLNQNTSFRGKCIQVMYPSRCRMNRMPQCDSIRWPMADQCGTAAGFDE